MQAIGEDKDLLAFKCLRCANCCENLVTPLPIGLGLEVYQGLCLFEEEKSLFPSSKILPMHGYGNDPYDKKFRVVAFQFTENLCPHLCGRDCSIHDSRPLSCQVFPVTPSPNFLETGSYWFDPSCSWTKKYLPANGKPHEVHAPEENFVASQILSKRLAMREAYEGMFWMFDLGKKEWILGL